MAEVVELCLLCGVKTTPKDRRLIDLSVGSISPFSNTLKRLYSVKLEGRKKMFTPDTERTVFSPKSWLCRKCFNSLTSFCDKETSFLNMIEKVLDQLPLTDHDTETTEAIPVIRTGSGAKRLFNNRNISSKKQRLNCGYR